MEKLKSIYKSRLKAKRIGDSVKRSYNSKMVSTDEKKRIEASILRFITPTKKFISLNPKDISCSSMRDLLAV